MFDMAANGDAHGVWARQPGCYRLAGTVADEPGQGLRHHVRRTVGDRRLVASGDDIVSRVDDDGVCHGAVELDAYEGFGTAVQFQPWLWSAAAFRVWCGGKVLGQCGGHGLAGFRLHDDAVVDEVAGDARDRAL